MKTENRLIHDLDTSREGMDDNAPLKILRPWKGVWRPIWSRREELGGVSFLISIFFVGMFSIGAPYFISNNIAAHHLETVSVSYTHLRAPET